MTTIKTPLAGYQVVETDDFSQTLFSEAFNEACHSTHGARAETRQIYLEGCKLRELKQQRALRVLEIGLGAGIGIIETLNYALENDLGAVEFITTEIDPNLAQFILGSEVFKIFHGHKTVFKDQESKLEVIECESDNFKLSVVVGDARIALSHPLVVEKLYQVDAIYQDAFSPKRNPALWSIEWFELLLKFWTLPHTRLSTYSASNSIRKALRAAGWCVEIAPGFGPKRQSTRACPHGLLADELQATLARSGAIALEDPELRQRILSLANICLNSKA